ncbi:phospholipase B1, membrane-associated-like [Diorhabda carinulata]|uniref:phospholipase B1, membrane-associated-like n=1 Tax=Diorhabda carinulata TaxID=1163345 RepID=UPI0025A03F40|nr:phospholipase B1, membrane-associated-like [Diorhabda carinulata]XP_057669437.1 phospholipase B1, membrane-associated-like [Diorhabda carinulata]XP_057669438.1 phospholipase B1, membrane-associated-like [Diorhabda carinulata]
MKILIYKIHALSLILSMLITMTHSQNTTSLDAIFGGLLRTFLLKAGHKVRQQTDSDFNRAILEKQQRAAKKLKAADPFPCQLENIKLRSDTVPSSVHKLRPGDIDIIAGMGDSLSAGTGISTISVIEELIIPQRGRAWSAGGEKTWRSYLTLPNILKVFNPKLFGFALKASQSIEWESQFNVAENGAISNDMPYMVKELVKRIKQDPRVDLENHWKMVTIMIGDNDFCSEICLLRNSYDSLKKHKEDLLIVLRYLRDNLPRTIVNLVPAPRLDVLFEMKNLPLKCYIVQNTVCSCIRGLLYKNMRKIMSDIMKKWQQVDLEVSNLPEFDLEDFTVIGHTYTLNYSFPRTPQGKPDYTFLAPDCFHFSEKSQARFANDLWNSLLEPVGNKSTDGTPTFSKFNCPSEEHPYIYTKHNSQLPHSFQSVEKTFELPN